ncbi:MAG: CBS domain-containing protein [Anaerolineales bacterium]|jgi:acetoin utilization protein AcuB|nr:CBS domain-containing protein [Anaerolineales bacterium]
MRRLLVKDWMTPHPITIHPQSTLPQVRKLMEEHHIRRLPVMEDDELLGIITIGDIREAQPSDVNTLRSYEAEYLIALITVDTVMTADPITVTPESTIAEAARIMLEHKISGLPVMKNGKLVGIITETDFCRLLTQI